MTTNNLFAIDFDSATRAVEAANAEHISRHRQLMDAFGRLPQHLGTGEDVARAKKFAKQLKDSAERSRRIRLEDTKPLRELLKRVEALFKDMEKQAKRAYDEVLEVLSEEGRRRAITADPSDQSASTTKREQPIFLNAETGEVIGSTTSIRGDHSNIPLLWQVKAVDRDTLDLEALRPHITNAALLSAARAHLKVNGPNSLRGAVYEQRATLD